MPAGIEFNPGSHTAAATEKLVFRPHRGEVKRTAPEDPPRSPPAGPAAIARISDEGRAALAAAQPPVPANPGGAMLREMMTGADRDYRTATPGHKFVDPLRAPAGGAAGGHSNLGGNALRVYGPGDAHFGSATGPESKPPVLAHEAAHTVQQRAARDTGDRDGDPVPGPVAAHPPGSGIQEIERARHEAAMNSIRNMKA